jgi:hypothetical protein
MAGIARPQLKLGFVEILCRWNWFRPGGGLDRLYRGRLLLPRNLVQYPFPHHGSRRVHLDSIRAGRQIALQASQLLPAEGTAAHVFRCGSMSFTV